ncbi:DUF6094 domain-containing protein [Rhizobium leguminosarum]|uniref:SAM-dependent methyltransferase n=1 Tax=Rhizobium leguminosarum TaxID=384 RepID=A0A7K3VT34_RHILE|nr:DUF6094 domain-containing protein [Rhizobium leguminosarum]NEK20355.1 hypothetical protein [Rhizobium leguminosarum]NKK38977.1 hypothetical protein [Rhizobium leguminosarum bv. viciae]
MKYGRDSSLTQAMLDDATDGYSGCPEQVVEILKTWVFSSAIDGTLFDNCAGDGVAASKLSRAWNLRPILVEPHPARHALCLRFDRNAICAPAQHVLGRGPTVWFFNPPYDFADKAGSMEKHLLWSAIARVPLPDTLCIWLLPRRLLDDLSVKELVSKHLDKRRIFRFPTAWEDYRQIAILGYWTDRVNQKELPDEAPVLDVAESPYFLKAVGADFSVARESLPSFVAAH